MWSPGQLCSKAVLAQMQILILILLYVFVFLCPAEVSVVALSSIGSASPQLMSVTMSQQIMLTDSGLSGEVKGGFAVKSGEKLL